MNGAKLHISFQGLKVPENFPKAIPLRRLNGFAYLIHAGAMQGLDTRGGFPNRDHLSTPLTFTGWMEIPPPNQWLLMNTIGNGTFLLLHGMVSRQIDSIDKISERTTSRLSEDIGQ